MASPLNNYVKWWSDGVTSLCLICKRENRFHKVFYSPYGYYVKQLINDKESLEPLVPSNDHYAIVDNLQYLEYQYERRKK